VLLLGGVPFEEELLMWWNFVARSRDEIEEAQRDWNGGHERFGDVESSLSLIPAPRPNWLPL
jgi:quercetin 2,3-dioxygenase